MTQYIDKSALVAEIESRRESNAKERYFGRLVEDNYFLSFLDTLEMKEVDLEEEINRLWEKHSYLNMDWLRSVASLQFPEFSDIAKHFFELGMRVNNPITAADRGTAEEIIINLKRVEKDYRIDLTREIEWLRNQVQKGE